jgi:hypothetical protein
VLKNLAEFWWILAVILYFVLLAVVIRRGLWATVGEKIYWATTCVLILTLPTTPEPSSYFLAVIIVLNLLLYRRSLRRGIFKLETPSSPPDR